MIHTRTKIIAGIALGLCAGALALYLGFFWIVNNHKETLYEERTRAAEAEVQAEALSALEETVMSSKDDREKLANFILADEEIIDFLSLIERTAIDQRVKLTVEDLKTLPIDDTFEDLLIPTKIDGSFDGVMRMLRILETIPEQSSIPSITLSKGESGSADEWTAHVEIRVTKYKKI